MMRRLNAKLWLALIIALAGGCNGSEHTLVPVTGRVTQNDKPVVNASITFQPMALSSDNLNPGPGSFGRTDADGRYSLRTFDLSDQVGAVVGKHRVTVRPNKQANLSDAAGETKSPEIPAAFTDGSLIIEVPDAGLENANIDLARPSKK